MAIKIILGKTPKAFPRVVKFPLVDGGEGCIEVVFKYRTRTEFGAFVDELMNTAGVKPASATDEDVKFSLEQAMEKTRDANADYLLKVLDGWNLDVDFSRDAVVQLCDEYPGAAIAVMDTYRLAITEGRLGN